MLETLLWSKLRAKLLGWLFTHPDKRYFVRQITALVGEDSTNVSRELARLEKIGILISTIDGRQKYYQANAQSPVFAEIKSLVSKIYDQIGSPRVKNISVPKNTIARFCRRHHIHRLSLFGSVLRNDFGPDSDIDVLVEFEPGHVPGFGIVDMESELSRVLGRKVDLRTPAELSRYFREQVVKEAEVKYSAV
jgi:predicted nucleotidyltransferase